MYKKKALNKIKYSYIISIFFETNKILVKRYFLNTKSLLYLKFYQTKRSVKRTNIYINFIKTRVFGYIFCLFYRLKAVFYRLKTLKPKVIQELSTSLKSEKMLQKMN